MDSSYDVTYKYGAFGLKLEQATDADGSGAGSPVTLRHAYDGSNANSSLTTHYDYGDQPDQLLARNDGAAPRWYLPDRLHGIGNGASNNLLGSNMNENDTLIRQLEESGKDVFWQGQTSSASIEKLESLLGSSLPASFRSFLSKYGGGGLVEEEISGIENDDATLEHRGTVYGDTLICRKQYGLPSNLVAIYLGQDDIVWCLDIAQFRGGECPVVSFDVFSKKIKTLANTFDDFLSEYLALRISR